MDIDAMIAEAQASVAAQPQPDQQTVPDEGTKEEAEVGNEVATDQESEGNKSETQEKTYAELPKPVANKISRQDKKIGKLTAEKYALQQRIEVLEKQSGAPQKTEVKSDAPKEEDYATYGEYLRAEAKYAAKLERQEYESSQAIEKNKADKASWEAERQEAILENHQEASKAFSDFDKLVSEVVENGALPLSDNARSALYETENGAFALYSILKSGQFDEFNDLSPTKAAMMVARHEDKALTLSKQKQVTKAPTPMTPNKGLGSGGKPLNELTHEEAHKLVSTPK